MLNILFVDDLPKLKVYPTIRYLELQGLDFKYVIARSVNSALKYISHDLPNIDLAIVDTELPMTGSSIDVDKSNSSFLIDTLLAKTRCIPIVVNSADKLDESIHGAQNGAVIQHVNGMTGPWLHDFIRSYLKY